MERSSPTTLGRVEQDSAQLLPNDY